MTLPQLLRRSPAFRGLLRSSLRTRFTVARHLCSTNPPPPHPPSSSLNLQSLRYFCTPSSVDKDLLSVLKSEIEHEKSIDAASERDSKIPPKPFTIKDKEGAQEVFLYRSYNNEDISVSCLFQVQPYPEPNEDGDESDGAPQQVVQMTVKVSKGGDDPYLEIRCLTTGQEPVIEHVVYKEVATGVKDLPYEGPLFEDLDDSVQKGFLKYVEARGIDAKLGDFILTYMYHKEQREYSRWLKNLQAFLSK
ncbi:hypothetical protein L7F22_035269 [Adiantum nelumboides]|nr:hypothetical protein [Adiantum nelumboides]